MGFPDEPRYFGPANRRNWSIFRQPQNEKFSKVNLKLSIYRRRFVNFAGFGLAKSGSGMGALFGNERKTARLKMNLSIYLRKYT